MVAQKIVKQLLEAKEEYYNGTPIMSDADFDMLEEKLKSIDPTNEYFSIVGINTTGEKIKHKHPMLSMGKGKTIEDIQKWINKLNLNKNTNYVIGPKLDGISGDIKFIDGKLIHVATRGNGEEGQDITHVAKYIQDIQKIIPINGEVFIRGEFYLPKGNKLTNTKLRNICGGLLNRKEDSDDINELRHVRFCAYNFISDFQYKTYEEKLKELQIMECNTIIWYKGKINKIKEVHKDYLDRLRNLWDYETDGLIITVDDISQHKDINSRWEVSHHNHFDIALKPPAKSVRTILKDIEWNISKHGNFIPVAILDTVDIDGVNISRATLNNFENVENLMLHKGDTILIERASDVIPFIAGNETCNDTLDSSLVPFECPSCGEDLIREGVHLVCKNTECSERKIQYIISWCSEMDGVSEGIIRRLWDNYLLTSVIDLYKITANDIAQYDGFQKKSATKIIKSIQSSKSMTVAEFIDKLSIPLVGIKAVKKLGIETMDDFFNFSDDTYVIGQNIIKWISEKINIDFVKELISVLDIKEISAQPIKGSVAMTGSGPKTRNELIKDIESMGYEFTKTVNKNTSILLCSDSNSGSKKIQDAKKKGIQVINYEDFLSSNK